MWKFYFCFLVSNSIIKNPVFSRVVRTYIRTVISYTKQDSPNSRAPSSHFQVIISQVSTLLVYPTTSENRGDLVDLVLYQFLTTIVAFALPKPTQFLRKFAKAIKLNDAEWECKSHVHIGCLKGSISYLKATRFPIRVSSKTFSFQFDFA